jgi:drug/metabolite transporter superfamily protein YnfA
LKSSDTTGAGNRFGLSVAVSGDTIVVGEPKGGSSWYEGAAYVFVRSGSTWSPQATLAASSPDIEAAFGYSVAIEGDTLVIGEPWSYMSSEGGEVYVYVRGGTTWSQQARLHHNTTYSLLHSFGCALAISDNTVVVGAVREGTSGESYSGKGYVFVRNGTTWSRQAKLEASNTERDDWFGSAVAISGNIIAVGAVNEDSTATGTNGDQADNSSADSGAVYLFMRKGASWSQQAYIKASNTDAGDFFGAGVAISGGTLIIGASGEASSATGINGNQADNSLSDAGAVYEFSIFGQAPVINCAGGPGGFCIEWNPVEGMRSVVKCSPNLVYTPFTDLSAALPYPVNSYTDTVSNGKCFYKVELQP